LEFQDNGYGLRHLFEDAQANFFKKKKMHKPTDHPIIGSLCWAIDADEAAAGGGPLENQRRSWGSSA